ncbi:hypothetical protein NSQ41_17900 [Aeribacillus sp. FSL K6-8210]|jgi:hypothetical protein|uniref:hypothetical protein n=1 Tax=unclassified Aeribacillus TaxID=2640495 RepID=UPI0030D5DBEA
MYITIALTEHMFPIYLVAKFSLERLPVGICQEVRIRKAMGSFLSENSVNGFGFSLDEPLFLSKFSSKG